jgi:hypothetical protein
LTTAGIATPETPTVNENHCGSRLNASLSVPPQSAALNLCTMQAPKAKGVDGK